MLNCNSYLKKDCNRNFILNYNAVQSNMNKFKMDKLSIVPQYKKMLVHCPIFMNYKKLYQQLIDRSRQEKRVKHQGIYYEEHHIIPKCIGGSNDEENLVLLTAREHFIVHWILTKIYPNEPGIIFAFNSFCMKLGGATNKAGQLDTYSTSKNYEYARRKIIQYLRSEKNPLKGVCNQRAKDTVYINDGTKSKRIKIGDLSIYLENGWTNGRLTYKRKPHSQETKTKISRAGLNRVWSESSKQKISDFQKQHPHCWISKNGNSKQIFVEQLETYLASGWQRGRHVLKKQNNQFCYFKKCHYITKRPIEYEALFIEDGWEQVSEYDYKHKGSQEHQVNCWINKDNKSFRVHEFEINIFLKLGYKIGRGKRTRR